MPDLDLWLGCATFLYVGGVGAQFMPGFRSSHNRWLFVAVVEMSGREAALGEGYWLRK